MGNLESTPTVTACEDFDPDQDCERLHNAMDGCGTNERPIIRILTRRSTLQRQILKERYEETYGENLMDKLKSELRGDLEDCVMAVMDPPVVFDAKQLRRAMIGPGTNDEILIEILCTRSNEKINLIRATYAGLFDRALAEDLSDETSGDFKHLLLAMVLAERDELFEVDEDAATEDAQAIFDAGENRWFGTDEDVFTKVLATRSYLQLRIIFNRYADIAGNSFEEAIEAETSGNLQAAYKAIYYIATDHYGYYAQKLNDSLRGIGTDDAALIRNVVGRSEIDLGSIKDRYEEMFGKSLWQDISDDCSGEYKRMLMNLLME